MGGGKSPLRKGDAPVSVAQVRAPIKVPIKVPGTLQGGCLDRNIDCARPPETGGDIVGYEAYDYAQCCSDEVPRAVQQRAWTSPIWIVPEDK